ncbi:MAG: AAA family ATPase [Nitrospiraceae bacterium]|nr:AAA family ATPase [Nitrospiraceae bacterium]
MRLNSLTLFGFKSFPTRTQITFTKGIVIIVGPNGCGKSNIIDALRWVLGEQSPSMLRARSMDDCLYSGDGDRRIDMAEVRLVIDTEGARPFPELGDIPEIEIIRRIHRSGNTEYRINGKACRLKDIRYIFMDTGAGTRAYSIWDQGQIGAFVDMGPEERRHLIEEVAGISRYKTRRAEAEQRMSQTRQNLERLEDVLAELERHRRSLSRQAKRTEHYLEFRKEQDKLDQALLSHTWSAQMDRRAVLEKEKEGLSVSLSSIQADLSKELSKKEDLELKVLEAEEKLAKIRHGLTGAEQCLQGLKEEAAGQEKAFIKEEDRLRSNKKAISEIEDRQVRTGLTDKAIREKIEALKKEEALCLTSVSSGVKGVEESEKITEQLKDSLEAVKDQFVDATAKYTRLDSRCNSLRDQRDRLIGPGRSRATRHIRRDKGTGRGIGRPRYRD